MVNSDTQTIQGRIVGVSRTSPSDNYSLLSVVLETLDGKIFPIVDELNEDLGKLMESHLNSYKSEGCVIIKEIKRWGTGNYYLGVGTYRVNKKYRVKKS